MSGESYAQFNAAARDYLDGDIGPAEDQDCAVGACEIAAVYRVPWPQFGGDVEYCPYHLARYRHEHPELWEQLQDAVDEELSAFATRGDRFLDLEDVPKQIRAGRYRRVGLTARGYGLFVETEPSDSEVRYVLIDRALEDYLDSLPVPANRTGPFLQAFEQRRGFHAVDPQFRDLLFGGDGR